MSSTASTTTQVAKGATREVALTATRQVDWGSSAAPVAGADEDVEPYNPITNVKSRLTYVKAENDWKYINIALVKQWKVKRTAALDSVQLKINDILVDPTTTTDEFYEYDLGLMRKEWFELLGYSERECDLLALERAFHESSIKAIPHFSETPSETLRQCIFTQELTIFFLPTFKRSKRSGKVATGEEAKMITIVEQCCVSDVHLKTYSTH